jgi:hypothetical protein
VATFRIRYFLKPRRCHTSLCTYHNFCRFTAPSPKPQWIFLWQADTRGNMGLFPISSGGGQFTFVPLTLWYKFATRGCRWICYSNCKQNRSKVQNLIEFLYKTRSNEANFTIEITIRLTEFILPPPHPSVRESDPRRADSYDQSTIFVVDFDRKHPIHLIL